LSSIITEISPFYGLLCLVLGASYALVLYLREYRHEFSAARRMFLGIFRFIVVSFIAFLLLSPFIRSLSRTTEDPVVVIAHDNSISVSIGQDSMVMQQEYIRELKNVTTQLEDDYALQYYSFGNSVNKFEDFEMLSAGLKYDETRTNLAQLLRNINDLYYNRNLGAVILASDGIFNSGLNPVYAARDLNFPVYTLGLGDTSVRKDILIANVRYNRLAYLDNKFPLEITMLANMASGERCRVEIYKDGSRLESKDILIGTDAYSETNTFILTADKAGLQKYTVQLTSLEAEISLSNNFKNIYVDILDSRNRILLLADAPHPDISAIKEALRSNINYEVDDVLINEFSGSIDAYNLVILHQIPSRSNIAVSILKEIKDMMIPALYIVGTSTNMIRWNGLNLGIKVQGGLKNLQEVLPEFNDSFPLFSVSDNQVGRINSLPPLIAPFGNYNVSNNVSTFLYQRIGTVNTTKPLICFAEDLDSRWGVIMGSGIWRWRLLSYAETGNHGLFND